MPTLTQPQIDAIKAQLLSSHEPAQRIINRGFALAGVSRFTRSGDDRWEQIVCRENGWEYEKPPRHLVDRWASY